jgi:hypothetical protein
MYAYATVCIDWNTQRRDLKHAGRADLLEVDEEVLRMHYKSEDIDLSDMLLPSATLRPGAAQRCMEAQVCHSLPFSPVNSFDGFLLFLWAS